MGSLVSKPKAPPPPAPVPDLGAAEAERRRRELEMAAEAELGRKARGRAATVLTGGQGVTGGAPAATKTLLGG